jgi:hypothetical protein
VEIGQFKDARAVFDDNMVFTEKERTDALKDIDTTEAYYRSKK